MAIDLAPHGIRANAICPGSVRDVPELESRMLSELAKEWDVPADTYEREFAGYHLLPELIETRRRVARLRLARLRRRP